MKVKNDAGLFSIDNWLIITTVTSGGEEPLSYIAWQMWEEGRRKLLKDTMLYEAIRDYRRTW